MPFLVLLAALVILSGPIALVLALVYIEKVKLLERQIVALRRTIESLGTQAASPLLPRAGFIDVAPNTSGLDAASSVALPAAPATAPTEVTRDSSAPLPPAPITSPSVQNDLESVIGGQWLTWIGVLAIFFGTAFFVAIDLHESPIAGLGQVVIGTAVAALFLLVGSALSRRTQRILGQGLLGGGIALLFLAAFAVTNFHELAPASAIYVFLTLISIGGALIAIRMSSGSVAGLTLIGALLTPLFLELRGLEALHILPYLFVVNLGATLVSARRDWRVLPLGSFVGSMILIAHVSAEVLSESGFRMELLAGTAAIWLLFAILPLVSRPGPRFWSAARGIVVFLNAGGFVLFLYHWLSPEYIPFRGLVTTLLGLAYVSAGILGERPRNEPLARATQYTGIALLCVAVPIQLDLGSVTLAWAILGAALVELGSRRGDLGYRGLGVLTLAADVIHAVMGSFFFGDSTAAYRTILNASFLGNLALVAALGHLSWRLRTGPDRPGERELSTPALLVAGILLWLVVSIETLHAFDPPAGEVSAASMRLAANLTLSLVWAIYGALLIGAGFLFRFRPIRMLGFVVIGFLVFKVFALDVQGLERGYRIASFVAVGLLLLLVSVLYQRGRQRTIE